MESETIFNLRLSYYSMMPDSFDHRLLIKKTDTKYYDQALFEFCDLLDNEMGDNLESVILYGSLARNSIIPGWSDLDILIVLTCEDMNQFTNLSNNIQLFAQMILNKYSVYLSLDVIRKEELPKQSDIPKLLGNPIIKTYEIKKYGKCIKGENILDNLEIEENIKLLKIEEYLNILLSIHNYRKFCSQANQEKEKREYLIAKIILGLKTILKVLKGYYNILGGRETSIYERNKDLFLNLDPKIPNSRDIINILKLRYRIEDLKSCNEIKLEKMCNEIITLSNMLVDYIISKVDSKIEV